MNYKELFNKMAFLLSSPGRFWEKEAAEGQGSRMMSEYVYPLIGLCGLSEFIGTFIGRDVSSEYRALLRAALTSTDRRSCGYSGMMPFSNLVDGSAEVRATTLNPSSCSRLLMLMTDTL
jgi:hypothetical protein